MFIKFTTTEITIDIRHTGIMKSTQRRNTNFKQTIMIPNIVETEPIPIQLFKGTKCSIVKVKQPITPPAQTTAVTIYVSINKQHKVNLVEPSISKTHNKFIENFAKTLPGTLIAELENNNGKSHRSKLFTEDVVLRHVLPHVLNYYQKIPKRNWL